jgi:hypothetical protein
MTVVRLLRPMHYAIAMKNFIERHIDKIAFTLSCYDRLIITGSLVAVGHADAMTRFIRQQGIPIFEYPDWANRFREELRAHAESVALAHGVEIDFIQKKDFRKEDRIQEILRHRGGHSGLVHIFSAMEPCTAFKPWHDKQQGKTFLRMSPGKCLHYYFYFILPEWGLCHLRVPTWAPFRLQFYCNGHNVLARQLQQRKSTYSLHDNAFIYSGNPAEAQTLADAFNPVRLHKMLDNAVHAYCPIVRHFPGGYHWSLMQVEYATDIVFKRRADLKPLYEELVRTAVHAVKPEHVGTFLGRTLTEGFEDELGNDFHTRIQGTRIKHHMGKAAIKMYDKHGIALRIETTTNDVSFFKHYREVVHRDGSRTLKYASFKKSIYSLPDLASVLRDANRRYIEFISAIDDPTNGIRDLEKVSRPVKADDRTYRGFNLFHGDDLDLFIALVKGEFNISGFRNRQLRDALSSKTASQMSAIIRRLRKHGLIKKVIHNYKYYLTGFGRRIIAVALKLREMFIIPSLRGVVSVT